MIIDDVKTIDDFRNFIALVELSASTDKDSKDFKWAIWNFQNMESEEENAIRTRYTQLTSEPHFFYYKELQKDDRSFTLGIVFPISIVVNADINVESKTMKVFVTKQSFYWQYSREDAKAIRHLFSEFKDFDESTIQAELANPAKMDSQSPSHPPTN
ncbi:hypothetical protein [Runella sp.]|uniref:hypothetical protein n=1 Tax=Runella sp. TaxID=1960881 RepID=UPI003D0FA9F6